MLPQWHVKDPSHSAKSAGGRLHLNMHTPLTQRSRSGLTMLLSRHSVGTYQETSSHVAARQGTLGQSSQLIEPLWTDPDLKSGISVRKLIFTLKQTNKNTKKSCRQGMNCRTFTQNPCMRGKSQQQQQRCFWLAGFDFCVIPTSSHPTTTAAFTSNLNRSRMRPALQSVVMRKLQDTSQTAVFVYWERKCLQIPFSSTIHKLFSWRVHILRTILGLYETGAGLEALYKVTSESENVMQDCGCNYRVIKCKGRLIVSVTLLL